MARDYLKNSNSLKVAFDAGFAIGSVAATVLGPGKITKGMKAVGKAVDGVTNASKDAKKIDSVKKDGSESQGSHAGKGKALSSFDEVAGYIRINGKLPDNYITKDQAKVLGWDAKKGNLSDIAPGKSLGGDIFKNIGNLLPDAPGRIWYEADINYGSGFRGSERILYSNDGLLYKSTDHYKTFIQIK